MGSNVDDEHCAAVAWEQWSAVLELANKATALSDPNPRVGCVLVGSEGVVLGQGHTQAVGQAHAEVMALRDAQARGHDVRGATAYVSLEPCAHHGRTPPCTQALITAGVARVEVALLDPNPLVSGQGVRQLQEAGLVVNVLPATHPVALQARELNIGFLSRMVRKRPWVRLKMAASVDGRTALPDGRSQWITSEAARADGHAWRARATAVLTGIGTVLADDPRLDVRHVPVHRQPWRVVLDTHWRTPADAQLLRDRADEVWIAGVEPPDELTRSRQQALADRGVQCLVLPAGAGGRVDLGALLQRLAALGVNELHVEAGAVLNGALIDSGWADEWLMYVAPRMLGAGRGLADLAVEPDLQMPPTWTWTQVTLVGDNVRLLARRVGADAF